MRAATSEALVVRALHAIVAIGTGATLAARAVTALFRCAAHRRSRANTVGATLINGARIGVIAIFGALAGDLVRETASGCAPRIAARAGTSAATGRSEFRATARIGGKRTQREHHADTQPVAEAARFQGKTPADGKLQR
jgi:hypothetical protein